jgi:hypothetical protein
VQHHEDRVTDIYDELKLSLDQHGAGAAIDNLCAALREQKDYTNLFYALLMKKRHELGVLPVPTAPAQSLPAHVHADYEAAIREAAQVVGKLYLEAGNIPGAWAFYRMLGEPGPVRAALEHLVLVDGEDPQPLIDIAYQQGVHPMKGFDLVLDRYGICSAITMVSGGEFPHPPEVREHCIRRLVRSLYQELVERLTAEIERVQNFRPTAKSVPDLIAGRDWLFVDDLYHIDISHLGAVVQMSMHLPCCEELQLARDLCVYGQHLSPRFQFNADPPFENQYRDYAVYLAILAGDNVEEGLAHFRAKVEDNKPEEVGTYPAEVLVNLLVKLGRDREALDVARRRLATTDPRRLTCPGILELCEKTGDYGVLAEVAREQENPVHFVAGLLASRRG